jgi:hypothetical protein
MTITESTPPDKIVMKLEFMEPFEATNTALFSFSGEGNATTVKWVMEGEHNFMGKAMSLFMDMDAMVGKDFEAGLLELEKLAMADALELEKKKAIQLEQDERAAAVVAEAMKEAAPAQEAASAQGAPAQEAPAAE